MIYVYECACGERKEEFRRVEERHNAPACTCGKQMALVILPSRVIGDLEPYYDDNLQTHVQSRQHRAQVMREQGVSERFGMNWLTASSSKPKRTKGRMA